MEAMQEHTVTSRAARDTGQRGIKQEGGTGSKGGRAPMNPRNGKGKVTTQTNPHSKFRIKGHSLLLLEPRHPILLARPQKLRLGPSRGDTNQSLTGQQRPS